MYNYAPYQLSAADFNDDGAVDLMAGALDAIVAGDFNGDGITDLATATNTGAVRVLLSSGSATFSGVDYALPENYSAFRFETADLNADSDLDLLMQVNGDSVAVLINQGDGSFAAAETYYIGDAINGLAAADIDLNGLPDLLGIGRNYLSSPRWPAAKDGP